MTVEGSILERPDERLARVLDAYARSLERIAASYCRTLADRDDLLQDFAVAIWTSLPGFRGDCSEKTFVLRVAHNRALAFLSKRGRGAESGNRSVVAKD